MWICPECTQQFVHQNQQHSCNDRSVDDFLKGKDPEILKLFWYFINEYLSMGHFRLHPAKSRIGFAGRTRFGYIKHIGRDFIDVALTFKQPYDNNLCFYRIGAVPGGRIFQHYLRLKSKEDINEEVRKYMKMAMDITDD